MTLRQRIFSIVATPVLAAVPALAQEPRTGPFEQQFGSIGLTLGDAARINLVNPILVNPPDQDCEARIAFLDVAGATLGSSAARVPKGATHSADFQPTGVRFGQRFQLRVVVQSANPPDNDVPSPCRVLATLEVYNVLTGRTSFTMGPAFAVNPPDND